MTYRQAGQQPSFLLPPLPRFPVSPKRRRSGRRPRVHPHPYQSSSCNLCNLFRSRHAVQVKGAEGNMSKMKKTKKKDNGHTVSVRVRSRVQRLPRGASATTRTRQVTATVSASPPHSSQHPLQLLLPTAVPSAPTPPQPPCRSSCNSCVQWSVCSSPCRLSQRSALQVQLEGAPVHLH